MPKWFNLFFGVRITSTEVSHFILNGSLDLPVRKFFAYAASPLHTSSHRLSNDDCLEDKREDYENCSMLLLCMTIVHNDTCTHFRTVLKAEFVGLGLGFFCGFI